QLAARGEAPAALWRALDHELGQLCGAEARPCFFRDGDGERLRAEPARELGRDGRAAADGAARDLARLADAHEQEALRLGDAVDEQRFVFLALVVARGERALETAVLERLRAALRHHGGEQWGSCPADRLRRVGSLLSSCSMIASAEAEG